MSTAITEAARATSTKAGISLAKALILAGALLFGTVLAVAATVGSNIVSIEDLARTTRDETIPQSVAQQERALATESLTRLAAAVVRAENPKARATVLQAATTLAQPLTEAGVESQRALAGQAMTAITAATRAADQSYQRRAELLEQIRQVDEAIKEMDDALSSIAEDSQSQVEELIEKIEDAEGSKLSRYLKKLGKLYAINANSQKLLTDLRKAGALLKDALSTSDPAETQAQADTFAGIIDRVQVLLVRLPSTGDYEDLPNLVDRVAQAAIAFDLRRGELQAIAQAHAEETAAIETLHELGAILSSSAAEAAIGGAGAILDSATAIKRIAAVGMAAVLIGLVVLGWLGYRQVIQPISTAAGSLKRLSEGEKTEALAASPLREIEVLRRAITSFSQALDQMARMTEEKTAAEETKRAEWRAHMDRLADDFEASVGGVVESVSSSSTEMQSSAQAMAATAEETNRQSTFVAAASEQATSNVQTVAAAAEELWVSIGEIGRQASRSAEIAVAASNQANHTNEQIQGLAEAAAKIGEVVGLINDIASQTNLLALNATIEAARAGDAGKGFAVVATEVKSLAEQTANATEEIGVQIGGIQSATQDAVGAIEGIGKTIGELNEIATSVASAVEEQGAATQEIARNVEQAAAGTQEVSSTICGVTQAAGETGQAAGQIVEAAGELSDQSETLRTEVDKFLGQVRAA